MKFEEEISQFHPREDTLLTIGVFDGVHLGHQKLIKRLKQKAFENKLLPGILTFDPHPDYILRPGINLPCLTPPQEKSKILNEMGLEIVAMITFSREVASLSARDFLAKLQRFLRMKGLIVGPDFALGRNREGDKDMLFSLSREMGFYLEFLSAVFINGEVVSSTSIRRALASGDLKKVFLLMGRPFSLTGKVVIGDKRGRTLGFPTANLEVEKDKTLPADGVYLTKAWMNGKAYNSLTSIGLRPTFHKKERTIETFILDFSRDIYGEEVKVEFLERLREEQSFASKDELARQIARDVEGARNIFQKIQT